MNYQKIIQWLKERKIISIFLGIIFFIILALISLSAFSFFTQKADYYSGEPGMSMTSPLAAPDSIDFLDLPSLSLSREVADYSPSSLKSSEIEIRSGTLMIKSETADQEFEEIKILVEENDGYIENSRKNELRYYLYIYLQARVPVENLDNFIDKLSENYNVENFEVSNYRRDISQQIDELEIIRQAIDDYNNIREEIIGMRVSRDQIELLKNVVDKMQILARQQRELERSLGSQQKDSDLATINITLTERLDKNFWPEDLRHDFRDNLSWAVNVVLGVLTKIISNSLVLLVKIIEYLIYLGIIILLVMVFLPLGRKVKKRLKREVENN